MSSPRSRSVTEKEAREESDRGAAGAGFSACYRQERLAPVAKERNRAVTMRSLSGVYKCMRKRVSREPALSMGSLRPHSRTVVMKENGSIRRRPLHLVPGPNSPLSIAERSVAAWLDERLRTVLAEKLRDLVLKPPPPANNPAGEATEYLSRASAARAHDGYKQRARAEDDPAHLFHDARDVQKGHSSADRRQPLLHRHGGSAGQGRQEPRMASHGYLQQG